MKFLMFVYGEVEDVDSETLTTKIAKEIQPIVISDQIKYIYGDGNSIFHFDSAMKFEEMSIYTEMVFEDYPSLMFFLIPFNGVMSTNAGEEKVKHILSLDHDLEDKKDPLFYGFEETTANEQNFFDIFIQLMNQGQSFIINKNKDEKCNLSLDELLDKINEKGMDSLSKEEKLKLDEYSK